MRAVCLFRVTQAAICVPWCHVTALAHIDAGGRGKMGQPESQRRRTTRGRRWYGVSCSPRISRGQSLIEFALILPLFMLLLFGVIEFALINASIGAFNFAAQDAARFGAISGPNNVNSDSAMLAQAIQPRITGVVAAHLKTVEIFKANEDGSCYAGEPPPCVTEDSYSVQTGLWTYNWPSSVRSDQLITGDYLGVRLTYTYTYITAFFATTSPTLTLSAVSVQRIEPQEYT